MGGGSNTLRAGEWKATTEGTWEKSWTHRRNKAPVLGRREEEGWATIEYSLHHREHTCPPASRKQCFPVHPPSPYPMHRPDPRLPAIPEGGPHHVHEANHLRGFPCPGLPALHPNGVAPSTTGPLEMSCSPDIIEQAVPGHPKSAAIAGWSCQF